MRLTLLIKLIDRYIYMCMCIYVCVQEQFRIDVIIVFKNRSIESNGSTHRDSHILFFFFFSFLHLSNEIIRISQRATSYQDRVFRTIRSLIEIVAQVCNDDQRSTNL